MRPIASMPTPLGVCLRHLEADGLYRFTLDGSMRPTGLPERQVDVDGVVRGGRGSRVIGVTFAEEKRHVIYFDPEYAKLDAAMEKAIPDLPMVDFLGSSADHNKLLIRAGSDSDPGRYYVHDRTKRTLNEILLARPALEEIKLASVKPITYPASDGTAIPAYLTLPAGKEDAHGLPAVVLPHADRAPATNGVSTGWPIPRHQAMRCLRQLSRLVGLGDAGTENGFQSWRTAIGDVNDAGRWLVSQGIADPGKLAIVGWSYGGYAALQSGVTDPDLFKAIVAIAPVTDLDLVKREARDYTNARNVADEIGSGAHIVEGSPLQNVQRIKAPVLMFHARLTSMSMSSSAQRPQAAFGGQAIEAVPLQGLEHSLAASCGAQMLDRIWHSEANVGRMISPWPAHCAEGPKVTIIFPQDSFRRSTLTTHLYTPSDDSLHLIHKATAASQLTSLDSRADYFSSCSGEPEATNLRYLSRRCSSCRASASWQRS